LLQTFATERLKMANIILRGSTWHARLSIPAHLRPAFNRREFTQSLKTSSKPIATKMAIDKVAMWKLELAAADGDANAAELLAAELRTKALEEGERGTYADQASGMTNAAAYAEHFADSLPDGQKQRFYDVLTGRRSLPFDNWVIDWADTVYSNHKTNKMAIKDVRGVSTYAPALDDVTKANLRRWLRAETRSRKTVERALSFTRKYWRYLQDIGVAPDESYPFTDLDLPDTLQNPSDSRQPFERHDLATLLEGIAHDTAVYNTAVIALYTGARISEVMALCGSSYVIQDDHKCLYIAGTKTKAADRYVPLHPTLDVFLQNLIPKNADDWLIAGVRSKGGPDRRADVLGKRFGRLKTKLGFPPTKVFHSLRKTFITMCEQAEAPEGVVADIVGHEKQTMTYGLYSGGSSIKQRARVIESLSFSAVNFTLQRLK
jgi:integrase